MFGKKFHWDFKYIQSKMLVFIHWFRWPSCNSMRSWSTAKRFRTGRNHRQFIYTRWFAKVSLSWRRLTGPKYTLECISSTIMSWQMATLNNWTTEKMYRLTVHFYLNWKRRITQTKPIRKKRRGIISFILLCSIKCKSKEKHLIVETLKEKSRKWTREKRKYTEFKNKTKS